MDRIPEYSPEQLLKELQKTIIGQNDFLKTICTAVWQHDLRYRYNLRSNMDLQGPKQNILVLEASGTGKTKSIQKLAEILDLPVIFENASELRGVGWRGTNVSSIVVRALKAAGNDEKKACYTIVVLDEIDKVFVSQVTDSTFLPTNSLLTIMGGSIVTHTESNRTTTLDSSNMLFFCLGAFDGLGEIIQKRISGQSSIGFGREYKDLPEKDIFKLASKEDLHQYGIPWEFLGRISLVPTTNDLSIDALMHILTNSQASPIKQYDNLLFSSIGVHVGISNDAARHIAGAAKRSRMGARELHQIVAEALAPAVYAIGRDSQIVGITLDLDPNGTLVPLRKKGRRPVLIQGHDDLQNSAMCLLSDSEKENLQSVPVPFSYTEDKADIKDHIINCCLDIQEKFEDVPWRPISQIHSEQDLASAMCVLATVLCTQLLTTDKQNLTMYDLFDTANRISPSEISQDNEIQPLNLLRKEFLDRALEHSLKWRKSAKIAKKMITTYASLSSYETKYEKH